MRKWLVLVVVVCVLLAVVWYVTKGTSPVGPTPKASGTTKLQITITGGFAYVAPTGTDNHLEIGYLEDWVLRKDVNNNGVMEPTEPAIFDDLNNNGVQDANEPDKCNVNQMGTELVIDRGTIQGHEPSATPLPANRVFDLDKAVVKFPALETANIPLTIGRGTAWPPTPDEPADPDNEGHWKDMVPSLKAYHAGTTINPNWRDMVNGRVVLPGGNIRATLPSNAIFKKAHFDFHANNAFKFKAAMTDKNIYTVDVPGSTIELQISNATSGLTKLVLQPQGNRVELILRGKHDSTVPGDHEPLRDFCTFYQLMQPMPDPKDFLLPIFVAVPPLPTPPPGSPKPSPGFFCSGDWF